MEESKALDGVGKWRQEQTKVYPTIRALSSCFSLLLMLELKSYHYYS